ncbi:hypothetical protein EX30DRAFT_342036 [Ascodesmis nigricans]|uniref:Secreted protein n=1 Tax=Ascodesmis nigricans TaxID=341454 RepID=A0A4S2MTX6_9PEZI|nr:hypothetical protein EX30DRAFT_342036 [Ascodesmis nigricans]
MNRAIITLIMIPISASAEMIRFDSPEAGGCGHFTEARMGLARPRRRVAGLCEVSSPLRWITFCAHYMGPRLQIRWWRWRGEESWLSCGGG